MSASTVIATGAAMKRAHIALCPFPFLTHPAALLHLGRKIVATVPDVQVSLLTTFATAMYLHNYLSIEEKRRIVILLIDDGLEGQYNRDSLEEIMDLFMKVARESIREGIEAAEQMVGVKISCLVADALISHVCQGIAEEKRVKWAALWNSASVVLTRFMIDEDELKRKIAGEGLPSLPAADLPDQDRSTGYPPILLQMLHDMSFSLPKAAAVIMNTSNSFDDTESIYTALLNATFNDKFLDAGLYFHTLSYKTIEHNPEFILSWLDTHLTTPDSVVYISYGAFYTLSMESINQPTKEDVTAIAEGLEDAGVPFLWYLPLHYKSCLPEGFIDRTVKTGKGMITNWPPHMSVLNHPAVGAQFTDSMWDSVSESIVTGVPMIFWPVRLIDLLILNKLVVGEWGIALAAGISRLTKSNVSRALKRMMLEEDGRKMREKIRLLKKKAEVVAADPNGSSTQNMKKFINIITS